MRPATNAGSGNDFAPAIAIQITYRHVDSAAEVFVISEKARVDKHAVFVENADLRTAAIFGASDDLYRAIAFQITYRNVDPLFVGRGVREEGGVQTAIVVINIHAALASGDQFFFAFAVQVVLYHLIAAFGFIVVGKKAVAFAVAIGVEDAHKGAVDKGGANDVFQWSEKNDPVFGRNGH